MKDWVKYILVSILFLTAYLLFYRGDLLSYDTSSKFAFRVHTAAVPFSVMLEEMTGLENEYDPNQPPLIYIILWPVVNLFDTLDTHLILLPFFIIGYLAILSTFYVIDRLHGFSVAFWSSLIIFLHPFFSFYIIGLENLPLFILCSVWTYYFLIKAFALNTKRWWILLAAGNIITVWAYSASIYLVAAEIVSVLLSKHRRRIAWQRAPYVGAALFGMLPTAGTYIHLIFEGANPHKTIYDPNHNLFFDFFTSFPGRVPESLIAATLAIGAAYIFINIRKYKYSFLLVLLGIFFASFIVISESSKFYSSYNLAFYWVLAISSGLAFNVLHRILSLIFQNASIRKIAFSLCFLAIVLMAFGSQVYMNPAFSHPIIGPRSVRATHLQYGEELLENPEIAIFCQLGDNPDEMNGIAYLFRRNKTNFLDTMDLLFENMDLLFENNISDMYAYASSIDIGRENRFFLPSVSDNELIGFLRDHDDYFLLLPREKDHIIPHLSHECSFIHEGDSFRQYFCGNLSVLR